MILWSGLIPYISRAWVVLWFIPIGLTHAFLFYTFEAHATTVNKIVGVVLQILGGILVLYSINDNLGLFRSQSIISTVIAYLKEFPIVRKRISVSANLRGSSSVEASLSVTPPYAASTLEERVTEIEKSLNELQTQLKLEVETIRTRIEATRNSLQCQISETSNTVSNLSQRLEHAAVGGFKLQAFGVFLAIYGAITSAT